MDQCGIYEQLITQIIDRNINREIYYVGERQLDPAEASKWLSHFLILPDPNSSLILRLS